MIKPLLLPAAVITAMLVTAYLTYGDVDFRMTAGLTIVWIGGPLLLLTTLIGFYRTKEHGWSAWQPAGWILGGIVVFMATLELSQQVLHWEEERAQNYPAQVEAELEQFLQSKGRYPSTLAELAPKTLPPRLIRYSGNQDEYSFGMEPRGMIWGGLDYDRTTKKWTYND